MKYVVILWVLFAYTSSAWCGEITLADKLFYNDQYRSAAEEYTSALNGQSVPTGNLEETLFRLGLSYFMTGDQIKAAQVWSLGREKNPAFFKGRIFRVPAASMNPTLIVGDQIIIDNQYYRNKPISRGDVVVFLMPDDAKNRLFIKRVMGLPGEKIAIKDKALYIDGNKVFDKYASHFDEEKLSAEKAPRDQMKELVIPANSYFLLGDNRDYSFDSRFFGPVTEKMIIGRALIVYASLPNETSMAGARKERTGSVIR
ncbi:signal peptidase I [Malonomonas rubra DSM 5091]|uniref:Signal peptidase I n=1 Tax=Malonomonas rubra DSM 5091 TaxID=1122189 RepID=A0A1M6L945_MALRU|nr:signal peptidase I [Malonomonas rubra]SHJ67717.1 signal peptidase I [Malonomonas rubra DSM 5091]